MKRSKQLLYLIWCFVILLSCNINSNSLKQGKAEKAIRDFISKNRIETSEVVVTPQSISKIEKTNIYSQFNTSVRVNFNIKDEHGFTLLFDFTRTPDNKWFLKSVEGVDGPIQGLSDWLQTKKNLNIAVQ